MSLMSAKKLLVSRKAIRSQDVFSALLVANGSGAGQAFNHGLDFLGKGGLAWHKRRPSGVDHFLVDTARGPNSFLSTNNTEQEGTSGTDLFTPTATGYQTNVTDGRFNVTSIVAFAFLQAAGFFTMAKWTGDGVLGRQLAHDLRAVPGLIIGKAVTGSPNNGWFIYHRALADPVSDYLYFDSNPKNTFPNAWGASGPTRNMFSNRFLNEAGHRYVGYLFAHNLGLIQCVGFTTDASGNGSVAHGWSNGARFVMLKGATVAGDWEMFDQARSPGWNTDRRIRANNPAAEDTVTRLSESGGVMSFTGLAANQFYVAMLIRNPT